MIKREWDTHSIRVNPKNLTGSVVALQGKFPLTGQEWDRLMEWLEGMRPELVKDFPT